MSDFNMTPCALEDTDLFTEAPEHRQNARISQRNEMGRRKQVDRRKQEQPTGRERRQGDRRRRIDPTTCERDYSTAEVEFIQAMDDYKINSGRMFPTCSEILEVVTGLGYRQIDI